MSALLRSLAKGTLRNYGAPRSSAAASAAAAAAAASSFFHTLNKKHGECRWNTPKGIQHCNMPLPTEEDGIEVVKLPAGTKVYHATVIQKGESRWFEAPLADSRRDRMWFASTPDHAQQMIWTHLLEYEVQEEITLQFIQNLTSHADVTTGKQYIECDRYRINRKIAKDKAVHLDGYAGCNECEYMLLQGAFKKLSAANQINYKSPRYLGGVRFGRLRKTRKNIKKNKSYWSKKS